MKKRKIATYLAAIGIIGSMLFILNPSEITFATEINATIKGNMNAKIGEIRKEVSYEGWHSSNGNEKWSGYWDFYRTQGDQGVGRKYQKPDGTRPKVTVQDFKMKNFFSGTWENLPGGVVDENYELPDQAKEFIKVYGEDNLGIRFNVGNSKSIKNSDIYYKINGDKINIRFKGILNYVRYNMWQVLNPSIVKQMNRPEVSVPQVLEGCGDNRLSLGDGKKYMKLTPDLVKKAYHKKGAKWVNINGENSLWATFSNGGNNGVKWYFPINVDFYDLNVYTNPVVLKDENIYKDSRGNWVKVGDKFVIEQSGYASNYDDIVKVNENGLNINGNDEAINSWLWRDETSSHKGEIKDNIGLKLENENCNRNEKTLNSSYELKAEKEGDYNFTGYSKLVNNVKEDNSHKLYKKSDISGGLIIKADGTAPTGDVDCEFNSDTHVANIKINNVSDNGGSGVKKVWVHYINKNNPKETRDIEIKKDYNGSYSTTENLYDLFDGKASDFKIEVYAEDNVGNSKILGNKDVDILELDSDIYRVLEPHTPIFMTNEAGIVNVNLFGGFDRLKIIFPKELTDLNNKLNLDTTLVPKLNDKYEYNFIVPQGAKEKKYILHVIGYKGNEIKESYPEMRVDGKVSGILKTRIRRAGDINSR